jgi:hypothetical protein
VIAAISMPLSANITVVGTRTNRRYSQPSRLTVARVPGDERPRITEPARFRLMHHAHVCQTSGESIRLTQAIAGKGVTPLN